MTQTETNQHVVLRFRQRGGRVAESESYQVEVVFPHHHWGGPLLATRFDETAVSTIRQCYGDLLKRHQEAGKTPDALKRLLEPLRSVGNQLFTSLPETVQQLLEQTIAQARTAGEVMTLVLQFEPSAQTLLSLPWELLHEPNGRLYIALQGGGLIRQLLLPTAAPLSPSFRPHATLGVWAAPKNMQSLAERQQSRTSPHNDSLFTTWIQGADTLAQLQTHLAQGGFDSLHIVAHGRGGDGQPFALALENQANESEWVTIDRLALLLTAAPSIHFVYLDVCASSGERGGYSPGGTAVDLLGAGVGGGVVMQDDVAQKASGLLADQFYASLQAGVSLAEAMENGRLAVRVVQDDAIHWSVPILYMCREWGTPAEGRFSLADWLLNRTKLLETPTFFLLLLLCLLVSFVARGLASLVVWDRTAVFWLLMGNLPILVAAAAMRQGQVQLEAAFSLGWREWLLVLRHKYTSALIWGFMGWAVIGLGWLLGVIGGWHVLWRSGERLVLWHLAVGFLASTGYLGARQGIRQMLLFLREAPEPQTAVAWGILLFALLMPLVLLFPLWFVPVGWLVVLVILGLLGAAVGITRSQAKPPFF